jgi:hypothetical protein
MMVTIVHCLIFVFISIKFSFIYNKSNCALVSHVLATTESCMHRAGFTKTRSHPPLQNFAKADNQKTLEARPHGV